MRRGSFDEFWEDMKSGVYDYTINGECSNCGECCTNLLPMSKKEVARIRRYIEKHNINEQHHNVMYADVHFDMTCPFRSDVQKKCLIYDVRPQICRSFRCDHPTEFDDELFSEDRNPVLMREMFYGR